MSPEARDQLTKQLEAQRSRIFQAMACIDVVCESLSQDHEYNRREVRQLGYRMLDKVAGQLDEIGHDAQRGPQ